MHHLSANADRPDPKDFANVWTETACAAKHRPSLKEEKSYDVAVIGGGFTGLSTALHLAKKGVSVCVLEARDVGWGASGRNGGQVIPGLKYDPPDLLARFGPELGPRLVKFVGDVPDYLFALVDRYKIACEAQQLGWVQPADNAAMENAIIRRAESWAALGANVELLDRDTTAKYLGSTTYGIGWLDRRGGGINPLSFARGLADAAEASGALIFPGSPVTALEQQSEGFALTTPDGRVKARKLVLATNGYTDRLWPGLAQSIFPMHSFQIATAPLSDNVRKTILPMGQVSSDTRRILLYFRVTAKNRLMMGGIGTGSEPNGAAAFAHLQNAIRHLFPQVQSEIQYRWYGRVAITPDFLPHLHETPSGMIAALGYNGRGVAMATAMGSVLARRLLGEPAETLPFPVTPIRTIPFHPLRNLYVGAVRTYYRLRDIAS